MNNNDDNSRSHRIQNLIKNCTIRVGERLFWRITKHKNLLKKLNVRGKKQNWFEEAIVEKLEREKNIKNSDCIPPERYLNFKIKAEIDSEIEKKVELIKKFRSSFSKKQWILEAIFEKLEKEEKETEKGTDELFEKMN